MINLPIFRAKKINSDEYVSGYLKFTKYNNRTEYIINYVYDSSSVFGECEIDQTTLAIHFPDMIDSQGNKIFASLSKDGKGGDILKGQVYGISKGKVWDMVAEYKDTSIWLTRYINNNPLISMPLVYQKNGYRDMKVIGIQE